MVSDAVFALIISAFHCKAELRTRRLVLALYMLLNVCMCAY